MKENSQKDPELIVIPVSTEKISEINEVKRKLSDLKAEHARALTTQMEMESDLKAYKKIRKELDDRIEGLSNNVEKNRERIKYLEQCINETCHYT